MRRLLLPSAGSLLLIILVGSFALALGQRMMGARLLPAREVEAAIPSTTHGGARSLPSPHPADYYAAITERPLFSPTRKPEGREKTSEPVAAAAPSVVTQPEPQAPLPNLRLMGTLDTGRTSSALIAESGSAPAWVALGVSINGWRVAAVGADWVELSNDDRNLRLEMYPK